MIEKLMAKLEKPPIARRSCCAYPRRESSSSSRRISSSRVGTRLLRRHVGRRDAAVDRECGSVDVGRFVRREEEGGLRDLPGLGEPPGGDVRHPPRPAGGIGEK